MELSDAIAIPGITPEAQFLEIPEQPTLVGDLLIKGTLTVEGATELQETLEVTGATTLSDTCEVTGATTLSDTLDVTGISNFMAMLNANGGITTPSITTGSLAFAGGGGGVSGTVPGDLNVAGDVTAGSTSLKNHTHQDAEGRPTSPPQ